MKQSPLVKRTSNLKYSLTTLYLLLIGAVASVAQEITLTDNIYHIKDNVLIPTKSGITISATIVQKKTRTEPLPVIIFYTTYHKGERDRYFAKLSADRDYVGVVAYARGIRTDITHYAPYENEQADIYDIIDWISNQQWCNGSIGMYGGSYTGFSQWSAVKKIHPALKTIVPQVAIMPGFDTPMENNVQMNLGFYWPHDNIYKKKTVRRELPFEWFDNGIAFKHMDSLAGYKSPIFQNWLSHPAYDPYWQSMVPTPQEYANIDIPILTTTGYYDGAQIGALQYFKLHHKYHKNANHYFIIGPYDHWGGQSKAVKNLMDYTIDTVANINMQELAYEWLDYVLKGKTKPKLLTDKVNYQVMGTNEWKHAPNLHSLNNDTLRFYLTNHVLTPEKPKKKGFEKQTVDFKDRKNQNNYYTPKIIFDTLDISNGLIFTSTTFDRDFSINGSFTGNLFVSINKKDIDVSLALYEQMPKGKYFFLTRYVGRASYAKDNTQRQLLHPHKKESIPFNHTRFVSKKIRKGSRLVVLLNINKHPFEIINYGSGKPVSEETIRDANGPLKINWYNDSYIEIPIWK